MYWSSCLLPRPSVVCVCHLRAVDIIDYTLPCGCLIWMSIQWPLRMNEWMNERVTRWSDMIQAVRTSSLLYLLVYRKCSAPCNPLQCCSVSRVLLFLWSNWLHCYWCLPCFCLGTIECYCGAGGGGAARWDKAADVIIHHLYWYSLAPRFVSEF